MQVEYHVIRDYTVDTGGRELSDEEIAELRRDDKRAKRDRFSLTSLCAGDGALYVGGTNLSGDVLHAFDLKAGQFTSLGFDKIACEQDHKIHRGLWLDRERNSLYFGLASLAPIPRMITEPGGRLMRYDLGTGEYEVLAHPAEGNWIQATAYDPQRQLMYSFTEPGLGFGVTDLATGALRRYNAMGSIVHIPVIDPEGGVWGTYGVHEQAFFRYLPDEDRFDFPAGCKFPSAREASNVMYLGAGPVDDMQLGPDGMIYTTSAIGEIFRIDWKTGKLEYICRPMPTRRLPATAFGPDGRLYGCGGDRWHATLFAVDVSNGQVEIFGEINVGDERTCYRPHDMAFLDGKFYIAETDNPKQSGVLWVATL